MHRRSRLTTAAALVVSTAALASPAMGMPYQDLRSADARDAAAQATSGHHRAGGPRTGSLAGTVSSLVPETEVVQVSPSGFDWGSAAAGAGAAIGISAISLGGVAGLRRRRSTMPSSFAH